LAIDIFTNQQLQFIAGIFSVDNVLLWLIKNITQGSLLDHSAVYLTWCH